LHLLPTKQSRDSWGLEGGGTTGHEDTIRNYNAGFDACMIMIIQDNVS